MRSNSPGEITLASLGKALAQGFSYVKRSLATDGPGKAARATMGTRVKTKRSRFRIMTSCARGQHLRPRWSSLATAPIRWAPPG